MRKYYTSKALRWKTLALPCEFMIQDEVTETQHSEKRQKYLNTALSAPWFPAIPPPIFFFNLSHLTVAVA